MGNHGDAGETFGPQSYGMGGNPVGSWFLETGICTMVLRPIVESTGNNLTCAARPAEIERQMSMMGSQWAISEHPEFLSSASY